MAHLEQIDKTHYKLTGRLDFKTVTAALSQFHSLNLDNHIEVDLSGIDRSNSAGLALLLELLADAKKQNRSIRFTGISEAMMDLAEMSDVEQLLLS